MAEEHSKKPGLRARRRERKRLKRERTGDTPEKRDESARGSYDAKEAGARAEQGGVIGGSFGSG
jgi:hypothetical protein